MTARLTVGVVDVLVVSPRGRDWRVLTLERATTTRCAGAWETVHGRVERGERPEDAAVRELREETGLTPARLYNVTTHAFYLHRTATVQVAVVFCALIAGTPRVTLGAEHARAVWRTRAAALTHLAWPSERESLERAWSLLRMGNAGTLEDVLRVR
jgi:8-oxo-dGTP pyrophosphatase MutT (NUDIX family)